LESLFHKKFWNELQFIIALDWIPKNSARFYTVFEMSKNNGAEAPLF
jgi:hypothetical protein